MSVCSFCLLFFFFFQAEDGIRDSSVTGVQTCALPIFAGIVVIVIALVSANTAAMAVRERRHELAVMRALGFTRRTLVGFIVVEGLLIGLVAGALGSAIAYIALRIAGPSLLGPDFGLHLMPSFPRKMSREAPRTDLLAPP